MRVSLRSLLLMMALCCVAATCLRAYLDRRQHRVNELTQRLVHLEFRQERLNAMMNSSQYHDQIKDMRRGELAAINAETAEIKRELGIKPTTKK